MLLYRIITSLDKIKEDMEGSHKKVLEGPEQLSAELEEELAALGTEYNVWNERAVSRLREDKRQKSQAV